MAEDKEFWKMDMANLVSIDWSIEEFRRLISEQPQSDREESSIEKSVDINAATNEATDPALLLENESSGEADAVSDGSVTFQAAPAKHDSSNNMVAYVMALTALRATDVDTPASSAEADCVRNVALDILNPGVTPSSNIAQFASDAETAIISGLEIGLPEPGNTAIGLEAPPASEVQAIEMPDRTSTVPSDAAEARSIELRWPLQEMVVQPDILAGKVGCERAIQLRWVLRDIRGHRLKWSPASEQDLKTLVEFDLVEINNGVPQLTVTGLDAV